MGEEINGEQKRILHMVKDEGGWKFDLMAMYRLPMEKEDRAEDSDIEEEN
jgi:hypothetical protein